MSPAICLSEDTRRRVESAIIAARGDRFARPATCLLTASGSDRRLMEAASPNVLTSAGVEPTAAGIRGEATPSCRERATAMDGSFATISVVEPIVLMAGPHRLWPATCHIW